jgi:hypothetical protein
MSEISALIPGVSRVSEKKSGEKVRILRTFSRSLRGFRRKSPEKKSGYSGFFSQRKARSKISAFKREKGKRQNSIKRPPKITKFEPRPLNTTKKLFRKNLPKKIKPSPPEK